MWWTLFLYLNTCDTNLFEFLCICQIFFLDAVVCLPQLWCWQLTYLFFIVFRNLLVFFQVFFLNAVVCGLEFCASAAFTYIPPMLLKAGLSEENMSFVLGIGPFMGFLLVPLIGRYSDNCRSKYGRRRPFILALSLILILSLLMIPYGQSLGGFLFGSGPLYKTFGIVTLIIGAVLLDFTSQATLTPCEALLSDACKHTNQSERCFMVYSFMVSLGGIVGYLITALDWSHTMLGTLLGNFVPFSTGRKLLSIIKCCLLRKRRGHMCTSQLKVHKLILISYNVIVMAKEFHYICLCKAIVNVQRRGQNCHCGEET